jgi:hypothetical protein
VLRVQAEIVCRLASFNSTEMCQHTWQTGLACLLAAHICVKTQSMKSLIVSSLTRPAAPSQLNTKRWRLSIDSRHVGLCSLHRSGNCNRIVSERALQKVF